MKLNTLSSKNQKSKKRLGRGIGSSKGKTSGRGHKGQKSRSGVAIKSFEGGQMPLYRRLPKRGFNAIQKYRIAKINLEKLQNLVDKKIINEEKVINIESLKKGKVLKKSYNKFKILGNGEIKVKLNIEADFVSNSAKEKIEKIGGKITIKNSK